MVKPSSKQQDVSTKVMIIGQAGVGKTTLIERIKSLNGTPFPDPENIRLTIGSFSFLKILLVKY